MRLHPLTALVGGLQRGFALGSFAFFVGAIGGNFLPGPAGATFLLVPVAFLLGVAYQVAYYYRFEYELTPDTLDIDSGVFGRTEREIPYGRIQNVDVSRSILNRLIGVAVLRVETAGGSQTEATLNFVAADEAERLQRELRERRAAVRDDRERSERATDTTGTDATGDAAAETDSEPTAAATDAETTGAATERTTAERRETGTDAETELFSLSGRELGVLALTAFRPATVLAVLAGAPFVQERVFAWLSRATGVPLDLETVAASPDLLFLSGVGAVVAGIGISWLLSGVSTVAGYHGFRLGRRGADLVYERGLLQRYSGSIPTDKVQRLTLTENVLMRRFGYAGLTVETAGYAPGQSSEGGPQSAVPLADRERTLSLARDIEPFGEVSLTRSPKVARRRYAVRYALVVLVLTGALWGVAQAVAGFTLWYLPLVLVPAVPVAAHLKWANRGYDAGEEYVVVRTGFWNRKTRIVPYYRLQTVVRSRTVFQRRLGLAHLTADTATSGTLGGAGATAFDIDDEEARRLADVTRERLQDSLGVAPVGGGVDGGAGSTAE